MKERPILFSAPMVRAILEGRKTMTRRVIKPQPEIREISGLTVYPVDVYKPTYSLSQILNKCPYGQPGDNLWVRETFNADWCDHVIYRADGGSAVAAGYAEEPKWKPSIFMPRCASRINLEITNVRVERLNDISEEDARAEGAELSCGEMRQDYPNYKRTFKRLWESINGTGAWEANPFVWVIEFKKQ